MQLPTVTGLLEASFSHRFGSSVMSSKWRSRSSSRADHIFRYGASHASRSRNGPGFTRYSRRCASVRTSTRPASRRIRRCLDTAGWLRSSSSTNSPTGRSRSRTRSRIRRLWGSARTSNTVLVSPTSYISVKTYSGLLADESNQAVGEPLATEGRAALGLDAVFGQEGGHLRGVDQRVPVGLVVAPPGAIGVAHEARHLSGEAVGRR